MELLYKKFRRRKRGKCNLCGKVDRLTWDHVPPQGGIELQAVEIDRIAGAMVSGLAVDKPEVSHDGLKFRTLCSNCNSLLGRKYDPALNSLARTTGRFLKSNLALPKVVNIDARPTAVARGVLGHLLAARLSEADTFYDPLIRELVFDEEAPIPKDVSVFYWIHPYPVQIVLRDCLMPAKRGHYSDFQRFGVLKYFPLAFLVTNVGEYEGLESLTSWRSEPCSTEVKLPVHLDRVRDAYWPEAPAPDNFLFCGVEGVESVQAHPRASEWVKRGN